MTTDLLSLKGRALRLLGNREYSRTELQRKLASFEEVPGSLADVLDDLQAKGVISGQRVLESVVNRRAGKLGAARIGQELRSKGLEPQAVTDAVAALLASEFERAQAVWSKKFANVSGDTKDYARQARFLAARGFSGDVIRRVLAPIKAQASV